MSEMWRRRNRPDPALRRRFRRSRTIGIVALAAWLAAGCSARHLAEAQDAFSKGAAVENSLDVEKARTAGDIGLSAYSPAVLYYKQADALLKREIADNGSALAEDRLLGNVYALRALALWRLSNLSVESDVPTARPPAPDRAGNAAGDSPVRGEAERYRTEAEETARQALQMPDEQLGARDRFMMTILPRLLDHDAGMQLAGRDPVRAHDFFKSAFDGIETEAARLPPRHDAVAYARMSQLQTLVAWSAAISAAPRTAADRFDRGNVAACRNDWIVPRLNRLIPALDGFLPHADNQRSEFVASRLRRIGFDVPADGPMTPAPNATTCPLK